MFWKIERLILLSVKNLVEYFRIEGNRGCYIGSMFYFLKYVWNNGGLKVELIYLYEGRVSEFFKLLLF